MNWSLSAEAVLLLFGIRGEGLPADYRPSYFVSAGGAAPMDRLITASVGLSDCNAPVVTTLGAISSEVNGHQRSLTPAGSPLNGAACILKIISGS